MGAPLDILILSHLVPWPATSGVLLRSYNLLREAARQHRVTLYAFNQDVLLPPAAVARSVRHLAEICAEVKVFPPPAGGSRLRLGALVLRQLLSPVPTVVPRFYSAAVERAVIDLLGRRPIRILQFETIAMAQYRALAADVPSILVHQNVESELLGRRARLERNPLIAAVAAIEARKLARHEEAICPRVDANVTVSAADRNALAARIPRARYEVVVNGVDVDYFRPEGDPAGKDGRLVFVGGMSWYPNRDAMRWFLEAVWPAVRRQMPEAEFTVVGSHPSPEVRRAESRGVGVRAAGLVDDIRPIVRAAALVVCPLRVGGGTRLKILDAWAMGKAVVSTSVGCEGLDARPGRDIEVADEAEAFAARVVALLRDRERRIRLGQSGRRRAETEFAWPRVASGMLRLYEELSAGLELTPHPRRAAGGAPAGGASTPQARQRSR